MLKHSRWFGLFAALSACTTYDPTLLGLPEGTSGYGADAGQAGAATAGGTAGDNDPVEPVAGSAGTSSGGGGGEPAAVAGTSSAGGAPVPEANGGQPSEIVVIPTGKGSITHERWLNVPGWSMTDFPTDAADEVTTVTELRAPATTADNYADRIRGYITAPVDGDYRFWLASDDNGELWLSTDDRAAHLVLIAELAGLDRWTDSDEWEKFPSQESALIPLEAGRRYYVEAYAKQGGGGSNLSVGWLKPGDAGPLPQVVPGSQLSPVKPSAL